MAQSEGDIVKAVNNMRTMGWDVREGTSGHTFIVTRPGQRPVTINARAAGHGTGLANIQREIRRLGYAAAWDAYTREQREERVAAAKAVPLPSEVFRPTSVPAAANGTGAEVAANRDVVEIDGKRLRVVDRAPAKMSTLGSEPKPIDGIDEIILEDNRILYQCVRSVFCAKVADKPESIRAHLRAHGRPQEAARRDRRLVEGQRVHEQRSAAGRAAHAVRRDRIARLVGDETRAAWLMDQAAQLEELAHTLRELARMKTEAPEPIVGEQELEELRKKAAKWDAWRELSRD